MSMKRVSVARKTTKVKRRDVERLSYIRAPLQDIIWRAYHRQLDLEDAMAHMCNTRVDTYLVHFLRAITAWELYRKHQHYATFIPGIDAYG